MRIILNSIYSFTSRWLFSTNYKGIGILYLTSGCLFVILGITMSTLIRMELVQLVNQILLGNHQLYKVLITGHVFLMIFFMVMPGLIEGFGNFFVPLIIGVFDMAFFRVNNISFLLLSPSLLFLVVLTLVEVETGISWTVYPPLSSIQAQSHLAVDLAIFSLDFLWASSILGSANFITTIFNIWASGIIIHRITCYFLSLLTAFILLVLPLILFIKEKLNVYYYNKNIKVFIRYISYLIFVFFILFKYGYLVSFNEGITEHSQQVEPWFSDNNWTLITNISYAVLVIGGVAVAGYGVYCFAYSSYGLALYTSLFGAVNSDTEGAVNSVSEGIAAQNPNINTGLIVNSKLSVVQYLDPITKEILHSSSLASFRDSWNHFYGIDSFNIVYRSDGINFIATCLKNVDIKIFQRYSVVDKQQIVKIIDKVTKECWLDLPYATHEDCLMNIFHELLLSDRDKAYRFWDALNGSDKILDFNVLESFGSIPCIADGSYQALEKFMASIYFTM